MEAYQREGQALGITRRGQDLLRNPMFNKGAAFTVEERRAFGLEGLLPAGVAGLEQQVARAYASIARKADPLEKYIGLAALQDRDEVLFYRVLLERLEELMPIVYTPTVGEACQKYSHIFRQGRGLWITPEHKGRVAQVLRNAPFQDVRLVVATDNERILGLGDQGAGGMGIPVGKLALYCVAAGIHPSHTLPISLDVGTDNQALLADTLYVGYRYPRLRGQAYMELVDELVDAIKEVFPRALLQWEDFKKANAFGLLDRHRRRICSFNDDIQGTAAVATACVFAASRLTGVPMPEQRVLILGAGAAGIGIARQLRDALGRVGLAGDRLIQAIAVVDSSGLLVNDRDYRDAYKREFGWPPALLRAAGLPADGSASLLQAVEALSPTVVVGTTGQPDVITEDVVRALAARVERPVVFPFSNPTSKAEARPSDLIAWSDGRAVVATGSPFAPVRHGEREIHVAQGNNAYVFPGVGLGVLVSEAREVSDAMFTVAAETLAGLVEAQDLEQGRLLPPLAELRDLTAEIAAAVVREAQRSGLARAEIPADQVLARVKAAMWVPEYPTYRPA